MEWTSFIAGVIVVILAATVIDLVGNRATRKRVPRHTAVAVGDLAEARRDRDHFRALVENYEGPGGYIDRLESDLAEANRKIKRVREWGERCGVQWVSEEVAELLGGGGRT